MNSVTHDNAPAALSFGEAALAFDIGLQMLLAVLVQRDPGVGSALIAELDVLLAARLPTLGTQRAIAQLRDHVADLTRPVH
ncbi:hypothetical protein [Uliginosibacterium sp. 31-12]|uniref:hypothetical protein n=1 Tax=Uliginosibacterium sp. 31-12 TaxID=3062781 RepID=UPI0026E21411|nr:hypothetical protein [Uliginosibacterium sp. 31-12]MDO6385608.1 hypothetical protein [Uliginosibacterium sp. 31-12]